ncbi:MAG TPA: hypothetical protein DDW52_18150 [Planctomycetaceae bacterium]|nr:hypothetical protein [Planctomycetaceae bacterium]
MINAALALAGKDLRSFIRDRGALVATILVPIMLVTVFGWIMAYAFGGGSGGMPQVRVYVCDLDDSDRSRAYVDRLKSFDMISVRETNPAETPDQDPTTVQPTLEKMVRDGDAHHILVIPKDFDITGEDTTKNLQMIRDPGRSMEDRIAMIAVMQASLAETGGGVFTNAMEGMLADQGMNPEQLGQITGWMDSIGNTIGDFSREQDAEESKTSSSEDASQSVAADKSAASSTETSSGGINGLDGIFEFFSDAVPVQNTDVTPPARDVRITYQQAQSVAGMSVMMLLFSMTSCGSVLLAERQEGTLRRLMACPMPRGSILLGKFLFVFAVGMFQLAIMFVYGELMFKVGLFRDPVTLLVLSVTWVAAGGAFGIFLATACKSTKQAEGLATMLILAMAALGGCWFPLQLMNLPAVLEGVCKSTMTYWAMTGFQSMLWNQLDWMNSKVLFALSCQWGWAFLFAGASVYFYRRNYSTA